MMMNFTSLVKIYLGKLLRLPNVRRPFYNFFYYDGVRHNKRALLAYRVHGVWTQSRTTWSAIGDVHNILRVLSELGYRTDVIDYADTTFVPKRRYDLFVGHEGQNFTNLVRHLPHDAVKIFYPMYAYWQFQNAQEEVRVLDIQARRSVTLHSERTIHTSDDEALVAADGVILLSNERGRCTYPNYERILILDSASYGGEACINLAIKDFEQGKNGFLFLAGSGNAHKRLDLLLEAFAAMPDKQLYICTKLEDDFRAAYVRELFETPNIHFIGHIRLYTEPLYELVQRCNHIIYTSVSEGSPGAVIDGMFQGLIPLVSRGSHIDVEGYGYMIEPCTVEQIINVVQEVSGHDAAWYRTRCQAVQQYAMRRFSEQVYITSLKQHIETIIQEKRHQEAST